MPWYLYHALKQLFPSGRFFSFFSFVSILGVGVGVWILIVTQSVMNGFGEGIKNRIVETQGDVRIRSDSIIYDWELVQQQLMERPEVEGVAPYAEGVVMLQHQNRPQFPVIRGIDPWAEESVIPVQKFITSGDFEEFDDEGVFLGQGLAYTLQARPGATVEVFTPLMLERLKEDEVLLPREFKVLGYFKTGSPDVDGNTMLCTLRVMQELYGLDEGVHGLSLRLKGGVDAEVFSRSLDTPVLREGLRAVSWVELNRDFLFVIKQEKLLISLIIVCIIVIASFSIMIALMMAVLRKTREIGLLVAMGARPREVAMGFCLQGFVIGLFGTACGMAVAIVTLHYRMQIVRAYTKLTNNEVNFLGVYDVYEIPVHYLASDFVYVTLFAVIVSTLAGLVPAIRAALLKPSDALRSE